jgi:hypothetical protein
MKIGETIERPIIILGAPRSGTTILFRCLALHPALWHLPGEAHSIFEGPFHPALNDYQSCRVIETNSNDLVFILGRTFYQNAINLNSVLYNPFFLFEGKSLMRRLTNKALISLIGRISKGKKPKKIRMVEKTPKNALRVPLLKQLFPDALFIWNIRKPEENIDSLIAGWYSSESIGPVKMKRFARAGYPIAEKLELADYKDKWWKFALVPSWRNLKGKSIGDVAAWQYYQCNNYILHDLKKIDTKQIFALRYEDFIMHPLGILRKIFRWAELPASEVAEKFAAKLPRINVATTQIHRSTNGLRYADKVKKAIERFSLVFLKGA